MRRVKKVGQTVAHPVRGVRQALQHRSSKHTHSSAASESGSSEEAGGSRTALSHDEASLQSPQMSLEYPQDSLDTPQQSGNLGDVHGEPLTGFNDAVAEIHRVRPDHQPWTRCATFQVELGINRRDLMAYCRILAVEGNKLSHLALLLEVKIWDWAFVPQPSAVTVA